MQLSFLTPLPLIFLLNNVRIVFASIPAVTAAGGWTIQGTSTDGVDQFQNIRFGQDTSGANRFASPVPYVYSPGVQVNGTTSGAACPQPLNPLPSLSIFANVIDQSEDCLSLRVARPAGVNEDAALPVMVFIYGGGYTIFGFAATPALAATKSLNAGLRDQRLGIQWVKDNIKQFGGNPDEITIFGQSAGAFSVGLQTVAFGGKQPVPFSRAIAESGAPASEQGINSTTPAQRFAQVASLLNCNRSSSTATLTCMRAVPLSILNQTELAFAAEVAPPFGFNAFTPIVDRDFIPDAPSSLVASGRFAPNVSLIQGWTHNDGSIFTSAAISNETAVEEFIHFEWSGISTSSLTQLLAQYPITDFAPLPASNTSAYFFQAAQIFRDLTFTCPAVRFAQATARKGARAYLYELNQTSFVNEFARLDLSEFGVFHFSDIPYVFRNLQNATASDIELASQVSGSWSAFAAHADPSVRGISNATVLSSWLQAFAFGPRTEGIGAVVNVIGGPSSGLQGVPVTGPGLGPIATEKLWSRCAFVESIQSATGGLGSRVLHHLLHTLSVPPSSLVISTQSPSPSSSISGVETRHGDFLNPSSLPSAFAGASTLLLVSYPSIAHALRVTAHQNAIDAAVRAGITYIVYTSLAFVGDSHAAVMQAHIETEEYLKRTCAVREGMNYTIIREGIYCESWALYLGFFDPEKVIGKGERRVVKVPEGADKGVAWVGRDELGEGTARILVRKEDFADQTVLLSGGAAVSLRGVAEMINGILGWQGEEVVEVEELGREKWVDTMVEMKTGKKEDAETREFMEKWYTTYPAIEKGELDVVDPLLARLLGRKVESMKESLRKQLKDVGGTKESIGQYAK
ncbi:hypothetical protein MMC17_009288 [Xylographa soralifera]|nr:hypothetical protein [Xylographa soralifera]